ncbi:MAG: hypothetical protein GY755_21805 [Chloroflexi bacterium]|nr:hypothetical protein [Chloroflexota bacterium]
MNDATNDPQPGPSYNPTIYPSNPPTNEPTYNPTIYPSNPPTNEPTHNPTNYPTNPPTNYPSNPPTRYAIKSQQMRPLYSNDHLNHYHYQQYNNNNGGGYIGGVRNHGPLYKTESDILRRNIHLFPNEFDKELECNSNNNNNNNNILYPIPSNSPLYTSNSPLYPSNILYPSNSPLPPKIGSTSPYKFQSPSPIILNEDNNNDNDNNEGNEGKYNDNDNDNDNEGNDGNEGNDNNNDINRDRVDEILGYLGIMKRKTEKERKLYYFVDHGECYEYLFDLVKMEDDIVHESMENKTINELRDLNVKLCGGGIIRKKDLKKNILRKIDDCREYYYNNIQ